MLQTLIVAIVTALSTPEAGPAWKDVTPPPVDESASVTRILRVPAGQASRLEGAVRKLFGDTVRVASHGSSLVLRGPAPMVELATKVALDVTVSSGERGGTKGDAAEPPGPERSGAEPGSDTGGNTESDAGVQTDPGESKPETARASSLRASISRAMLAEGLDAASIPLPRSMRQGDLVVTEQRVDLEPAPAEAILHFAARVAELDPPARIAEVRLMGSPRPEKGSWTGQFRFLTAEGSTAAVERFREGFIDFPAAHEAVFRGLESTGLSFEIRDMTFDLRPRTRRPRDDRGSPSPAPSFTVALVTPAADAHVRIEQAFEAGDEALFDAATSLQALKGSYKVALGLTPRAAAMERLSAPRRTPD